MELEDIMLSKVSQVQKGKDHVSSQMKKIDQKKNIYTKANIYIYIENVFIIVELLY
jgi:hypothetical protein